MADVDPDATAYANRAATFQVVAFGSSRTCLDRIWDEMQDHFTGLYLSFETDLRPERLHDAFPPRILERLRAPKARYDPDNVFRQNFPITPEAKEDATSRHLAPPRRELASTRRRERYCRAPWWRSRPAMHTERRDPGPGLIRANMADRQEVEVMAMVRNITIRTDVKEEGKVTGHGVEARVDVGGKE